MIFYNTSSIKFFPALLDKYKYMCVCVYIHICVCVCIYIYIYMCVCVYIYIICWSAGLTMSEAHTYENDFCCLKKSISQVINKHGLKKVLCVNQLRNKYKYSLVSLLKPWTFGLGIAQGLLFCNMFVRT